MSHAHPSRPRPSEPGGAPARSVPAETAGAILPDGDLLSCVVYTKPGRGAAVERALAELAGVQIHAGVEIDKLVVTIEDVAGQSAADRLGMLNQIEGVINSILIYHFGGQAIAAKRDCLE